MKRVYKLLFEFIFFIILASGVIAIIFHFTIQELDLFRNQVVTYLEKSTDAQVEIGEIKTRWNGLVPSIQLDDVSFKNKQLFGSVKTLSIDINLFSSFIHWRYELGHFTMDGLRLHLTEFSPKYSTNSNDLPFLNNELLGVLFHQFKEITLKKSAIIVGQSSDQSVTFTIPDLQLNNHNYHYDAQGMIMVYSHGKQQGELNLKLNLRTKAGKLQDGTVYLAADNVNIAPWNRSWFKNSLELTQGQVSLQSWIKITAGKVSSITTLLPNVTFNWKDTQNKTHSLHFHDQILYLTPVKNGWQLRLPRVNLTVDGNKIAALPLQLQWDGSNLSWYNFYTGQQLQLVAAGIDLEKITPLVGLFSSFYPRFYQTWLQLHPSGKLVKLAVSLDLNKLSQSQFYIKWNNISWLAVGNLPGMQNFSGTLSGSMSDGKLTLNSSQAILNYPKYFPTAIPVRQLQGVLTWQNNVNGLTVQANHLLVNTPDLLLKGSAAYYHLAGMSPWLSIAAKFNLSDAANAWHFYPKGLMSDKVINYLKQALQAGQVDNGILLFSGNPMSFPYYSTRQGLFQVYAPLTDAKFQFAKAWPALTHSNFVLDFINDSLTVNAANLKLHHVDVTDLTAQIPHYFNNKLFIHAKVAGQGSDITEYLTKTPLKNSVARSLQQVQIAGNLSGKLQLTIPFNTLSQTAVQGQIKLANNQVTIAPLHTQLTHVTGMVDFNNHHVVSTNIQALWGGQAVHAEFETHSQASKDQIVNVKVTGDWQAKALPLPKLLSQKLSGRAAWIMQVALDVPPDERSPRYKVRLTSDLSELNSQLPAPLNLLPQPGLKMNLQAQGVGEQFDVEGTLGKNAINSRWKVTDGKLYLQKMIWQAQQTSIPNLPKSAILELNLAPITLDIVHWAAYQSLLHNNQSMLVLPKQIVLQTPSLLLLHQQWQNLRIDYQKQPNGIVQFVFKGADIDGVLTHQLSQPWKLDLSYLYFNPGGFSISTFLPRKHSFKKQPVLKSLSDYPSLNLSCVNCWVFGQKLDRVSADIQTTSKNLKVTDGVVDTPVGKLNFSVNWSAGDKPHTHVLAKLSGKSLAKFNDYFDIPPSISAGAFDLSLNLGWQGVPWQPELNSLNGTLNGNVAKGVIHNIQMGNAGKILNVLSLEILVRQLQSDFKNVFNEGFAFSSITSNSMVQDGVIKLNKVNINGLAAYIGLSGDVDLNNNQLDVDAKIMPEISAGVGIATAFALNPLAGVFAYVGSKLFSPLWRNMFLIHYQIIGPITDPIIEQTSLKDKDTKK